MLPGGRWSRLPAMGMQWTFSSVQTKSTKCSSGEQHLKSGAITVGTVEKLSLEEKGPRKTGRNNEPFVGNKSQTYLGMMERGKDVWCAMCMNVDGRDEKAAEMRCDTRKMQIMETKAKGKCVSSHEKRWKASIATRFPSNRTSKSVEEGSRYNVSARTLQSCMENIFSPQSDTNTNVHKRTQTWHLTSLTIQTWSRTVATIWSARHRNKWLHLSSSPHTRGWLLGFEVLSSWTSLEGKESAAFDKNRKPPHTCTPRGTRRER